MKYYLAYGSNLNWRQMANRCPDAVPIGKTTLHNWKLEFRRGYLTIEPEEGSDIQVGIWSISDADEKALDRYEGFPRFYFKKEFQVMTESGDTINAMAYIMQAGHPIQTPADYYFYTVYHGYTDFKLNKGPLVRAYGRAKWPDD